MSRPKRLEYVQVRSPYRIKQEFIDLKERFLALQGDFTKYISVDQLIQQPTMDPDYVSVSEHVETMAKGGSFASSRITPPKLADMLDRDNREAPKLIANIDTRGNASLEYEVADIKAWAHLGLHPAEKLRGAMALHAYRSGGEERQQQLAIEHLRNALGHWDDVVAITRPLYRDMKLTHYNHNLFVPNKDNLFHWAPIRDEVARDVEVATASTPQESP